MPHPLKFPRVLGSVIPLMGANFAFVFKFVADGLLGLAAVIRALNELAEPTGRLRSINAIGVDGRAFGVTHFPTWEMWDAYVPFFTLFI